MSWGRVNVGGGGVTPYIVNVTCASDFAGQTITMSQSGHTTVRAVCPSTSPYVVSFKPMYSGTWTISGTVGGVTYTNTIALSAFGTYTSVLNAFNATLTVTSVEGAVVTATMGSLTVSGTIASGETTVSLSIPQSGTWSVTDDQSYVVAQSISITAEQTYTVTLKHELILIGSNYLNPSYTLSSTKSGTTMEFDSDGAYSVLAPAVSGNDFAISLDPSIDLTNFTYLYIRCKFRSGSNGGTKYVGFTETVSASPTFTVSGALTNDTSTTDWSLIQIQEVTVDISQISSSLYFCSTAYTSSGASMGYKIYDLAVGY